MEPIQIFFYTAFLVCFICMTLLMLVIYGTLEKLVLVLIKINNVLANITGHLTALSCSANCMCGYIGAADKNITEAIKGKDENKDV